MTQSQLRQEIANILHEDAPVTDIKASDAIMAAVQEYLTEVLGSDKIYHSDAYKLLSEQRKRAKL